jgi:adenylate cyclase class 2
VTTKNQIEIEIKIHIDDPHKTIAKLLKIGYNIRDPRYFEHNIVFDTADRQLQSKHMVLRLREVGENAMITLKQASIESQRYKIREEIETAIADARQLQALLQGLGYIPYFIYEKYRSVYAGDGVSVMVDETPIGCYIEIEGEPEMIDHTAADLGYSSQDYITATYHDLFAASGRTGHMVFAK